MDKKRKSLVGWMDVLDFPLIGMGHSNYHLFMPFIYQSSKGVCNFYSKLVKVRITIEELPLKRSK